MAKERTVEPSEIDEEEVDLYTALMLGFGQPKPEFARVYATGVNGDWFVATCPACSSETLVSTSTKDGSLCECDACPTGQFWFYAGAFSGHRRSDEE